MSTIDFPTLVVSSVLLLAIVAPFIYFIRRQKKQKIEFLNKFEQFVSRLNLSPELREDWRNRYILAFDKSKNVLIYYQDGDIEEKRLISLKEVDRITVEQKLLESAANHGDRKILDQVSLLVHFKNPNQSVITLSIYDSAYYSDLLGETVLAAKWAELINQQTTK
jgi:hypothetical protein